MNIGKYILKMGENSISATVVDNGKKLSKLQKTFSIYHHLRNYNC